MKKLIITIALFVVMSGMYASAQGKHEFSFYGSGGLSTLSYKLSSGNVSSGFGGEFGVGYTFYRTKVRLVKTGTIFREYWGIIHTGIGLSVYNTNAKLDNMESNATNLRDSEGDIFDLKITFSDYNEAQEVIFLTIPVMMLFQIDPFYIMCGVKAGIPISGKHKLKDGTLTNVAYYHEYENWAETQTFAGYGSFRSKGFGGDLDLGPSMMLALEASIRRKLNDNFSLYSGVYFDYGLNNISKGENKKFINYIANNAGNFTTNSVLASYVDDSNSTTFTDKVNTMAVGIKLRLAFKK